MERKGWRSPESDGLVLTPFLPLASGMMSDHTTLLPLPLFIFCKMWSKMFSMLFKASLSKVPVRDRIVSPPNSQGEVLAPSVTVFGGEALKGIIKVT